MNQLYFLQKLFFILVLFVAVSCGENLSQDPSPKNTAPKQNIGFSDPTKSMSNIELQAFDSLFNESYQNRLRTWTQYCEDSLNCKIIYHTARDGYALCINFINFKDSSILEMNLDPFIDIIPDVEFSLIEKPMRFIHTRRIMNWPIDSLYDIRFSGYPYQHYEFAPPLEE